MVHLQHTYCILLVTSKNRSSATISLQWDLKQRRSLATKGVSADTAPLHKIWLHFHVSEVRYGFSTFSTIQSIYLSPVRSGYLPIFYSYFFCLCMNKTKIKLIFISHLNNVDVFEKLLLHSILSYHWYINKKKKPARVSDTQQLTLNWNSLILLNWWWYLQNIQRLISHCFIPIKNISIV